jgi:uncharacterized protein YkwD
MLFSSNFSSSTLAQDQAQPAIQQAAPVSAEQPLQQLPLLPVSQPAPVTEQEQRFIDLVNSERWSRGLKTLKLDPLLVQIAREHSEEMCKKNYFDHYSPTPEKRTAKERFLLGYGKRPKWALIGENLFYCSITDVNRGHTCLMNSPSHRENIVNPKFDAIGVGIYRAEDGEFWVTEMFLTKID